VFAFGVIIWISGFLNQTSCMSFDFGDWLALWVFKFYTKIAYLLRYSDSK